jgi:tetratricopeptide (TPR) repeat protein
MTLESGDGDSRRTDAEPSATEIRTQLARIAGSHRFQNSPSQRALLEALVDIHLDKASVKGDAIGKKVFPGFIPLRSTDVRVHALYLRKNLTQYYAEEGLYDPITMEVIKGKNHRLVVGYNPRAEPVRWYRTALQQLRNANFPHARRDLFDSISQGIKSDPYFAPILALAAEVTILFAAFQIYPPEEFFVEARALADEALKQNGALWRSHVADAACHMCAWRWELAASAFEKALALSLSDTEGDLWYLVFLVATDRVDEALSIAKRHSAAAVETTIWRTVCGLLLYMSGRFDEIIDELRPAQSANPLAYLPRLVLGLLPLAASNGRAGSGALGWSGIQELEEIHSLTIPFRDPYPGITILFLQAWGLGPEYRMARKRLKEIERNQRANPQSEQWSWDLAIAYMAIGRFDEAIEKLSRLVEFHHPLLVWLHRWPFLDFLREKPEFQLLVSKMGLPNRPK